MKKRESNCERSDTCHERLERTAFRAFIGRVQKLGYTAVEPERRDQPGEFFKGGQYIGFLLPNGAIYYKPGTGVEKDVQRLVEKLGSLAPGLSRQEQEQEQENELEV